eukprot:GHRQ01030093.1.p3 GENE.GHRQ01030093.1~~GHRQ01030093.1.p3  ORF type:complete len:103 (+),score=58.07 GHRQ01030093.1:419-727(+)
MKNINVYSVGMYVDAKGAKKALHQYKGQDVDKLLANQQVFDGEPCSEAAAAGAKLCLCSDDGVAVAAVAEAGGGPAEAAVLQPVAGTGQWFGAEQQQRTAAG